MIYAHGVRGRVDAGGMVVTAQYDTGEPMSYAKVNISAPGAKLSFQSGRGQTGMADSVSFQMVRAIGRS